MVWTVCPALSPQGGRPSVHLRLQLRARLDKVRICPAFTHIERPVEPWGMNEWT